MANRNATGARAGEASPIVVPVARDQDDDRVIEVPLAELVNVHNATDCGGRRQRLRRPNLGAYILPSLIPAGVPFGYSGAHACRKPVRIKVLVREDLTHPTVLGELRRLAKGAKLRRGYRSPRDTSEA